MATSAALNPDGSVSSQVPNKSRREFERQMAKFELMFGSAAEHGLEEGQIAPKRFCPPEESIHWGDKVAEHLGSVVLLSEVAVKATIESVAVGFGTGGFPKALVRLTDAEPLTSRSPVPEYAVFPVGQLVVQDHVFCGHRGPLGTGEWRGPYQPQARSQIVLIGGWRDGTMFLGSSETAWYAELDDGVLQWRFGGYEGRSLEELKTRISEMEAGDLFKHTERLARPGADSHERMRFGREWSAAVASGCRPMGVNREGDDAKLACRIEQ